MTPRTLLASSILLLAAPAFASIPPGGPKPPPQTWAIASANGVYLFVMRAATAAENEHPLWTEEARARARSLWETYPTSGLYVRATGERVWATDERMELATGYQDHRVIVLDDGVQVVWLAHAPHGPRQNEPKKSGWNPFANQYFYCHSNPIMHGNYPAEQVRLGVRIVARGVTVGEYRVDELVRNPEAFENEFAWGYKPWIAAAEVEPDRLVVTTLDDQRLTFNLESGDLTERESLAEVSWQPWLAAAAAFVVCAVVLMIRRPRLPAVAAVEVPVAAEVPDPPVVTPPPPGLGRRRSGWHAPVRR